MSTSDLGESLVGAYLRHVVGCQVVIYNSFFAEQQGEVDVVGIRATPGAAREVFLCEVTTHIRGMEIVKNGVDATRTKVPDKLSRLRQFAELTFPGEVHRYQWWSPYVRSGHATFFEQLTDDWDAEGRSLQFVINHDYTAALELLLEHAAGNTSTTSEPAYRMLQILTHLRGASLGLEWSKAPGIAPTVPSEA